MSASSAAEPDWRPSRRRVLGGGAALLAGAAAARSRAMPLIAASPLSLTGDGRFVDVAASGRALAGAARAGDARRVLAMVEALNAVRHCSAMRGAGGWRGHFYARLDPATLARVDGAIVDFAATRAVMAGAMAARVRFGAGGSAGARICAGATALLDGVDNDWAAASGATGWSPESGFVGS